MKTQKLLSQNKLLQAGRRLFYWGVILAAVALAGLEASVHAQSLNVTDFGAAGDAVQFYVSTTAGSPVVTVTGTNQLSSADIGKTIELFRVGTPTYGFNSSATLNSYFYMTKTPTNSFVGYITNVLNGTNVYCYSPIYPPTVYQSLYPLVATNTIGLGISITAGGGVGSLYSTPPTNDNQDLIAVITSVVNGTNIYVSPVSDAFYTNPIPQTTSANVFATYGTDNTPAFSKAIAACAGYTNATINIPNGTFLLMPAARANADGYGYGAICLKSGGLHFLGASQTGTVLLSRGAWQFIPAWNFPFRGQLFQIVAPVTNDYPVILDNLTLDGGVQQGYVPANNAIGYLNTVDGLGWDPQHDAYITYDSQSQSGTASHQVFTNVTIQHWRGEMIKSIDANTNGNISIYNCTFNDGSATALNVYGMWDVTGNTFTNLFQIAEYYQRWVSGNTNTSYFRNNRTGNIWANGFAFNGGSWTAPLFVMESNVFNLSGGGYNGIMTMPAANIQIINNTFNCADFMQTFHLGADGSQVYPGGIPYSSNIVISGNSVYAPRALSDVFEFGGPGCGAVYDLFIYSNTISVSNQIFYLINSGPASWRVKHHNNSVNCPLVAVRAGGAGTGNSPFVLIATNNSYTGYPIYIGSVQTNTVSYSSGPNQNLNYVATGSQFVLNDSESNQIPAGACFNFDNRSNTWAQYNPGQGDGSVWVQTSQSSPATLPVAFGNQVWFYWSNNGWTTNLPSSSVSTNSSPTLPPAPPWGLHITNVGF
jgi:hypothetical protein